MMTVAQDEVIQDMIRTQKRRGLRLSTQIKKLLRDRSYRGKAEKDVFFDAYGRGPEGLRVYLKPKKSEDPCVTFFCTQLLKRIELKKAQKKEEREVRRFITKKPAA